MSCSAIPYYYTRLLSGWLNRDRSAWTKMGWRPAASRRYWTLQPPHCTGQWSSRKCCRWNWSPIYFECPELHTWKDLHRSSHGLPVQGHLGERNESQGQMEGQSQIPPLSNHRLSISLAIEFDPIFLVGPHARFPSSIWWCASHFSGIFLVPICVDPIEMLKQKNPRGEVSIGVPI